MAEVRQFAKMLYNASAFSEQDRGALMARVISVFPDLHAIVLDALVDTSDKPEPIFVSWDSLEAREKELEELVNVKVRKTYTTRRFPVRRETSVKTAATRMPRKWKRCLTAAVPNWSRRWRWPAARTLP